MRPVCGRRWRALVLVAFGAFLLTGAAMLRWYAAPRAALLPLDPDVTVTLTGTGLVYDVAAGAPVAGDLTERVAVRGGGGAGGVAVWDVDRRLARADGTPLRLDSERVALDRRTAAAVACCGERPRHTGLSYAFPPGCAPTDQPLWDQATGRAAPAAFAGEETVAGLRVRRYEQAAGATDLGTAVVPGGPAPGADRETGRRTAETRRTLWVEPASGVVVRALEWHRERLTLDAGRTLTLLDAELGTDAASVGRLTRLAQDRRTRLAALRTPVPLAVGVAGLLALACGLGYLIVTRRGETAPQSPFAEVDRW